MKDGTPVVSPSRARYSRNLEFGFETSDLLDFTEIE